MLEQKDFSFIYKYFMAEKQAALLFLIIGIVAIILAVIFIFFIKSDPSFYKGAAIPLLTIGLIQITVGYVVYTRSDKQKTETAYHIGIEPVLYTKRVELPRMKTVMNRFVIYRWVEIVFLIIGLMLIYIFRLNADKSFWFGLGITLAIQAIIILGNDAFAEKRGLVYSKSLDKLGINIK